MDTRAHTKSAATLAVLAVIFMVSVAWAWSEVTAPFPAAEERPACVDTAVAAGDRVTPSEVLVNVLNASTTEGLAGETMDALVRKGFAEGARGNVDSHTGTSGAVIWAADPDGPDARLLRSYFGKDTKVVDRTTADPGITVVVGGSFPGIHAGRPTIVAKQDGYVCSPPDPVGP